MSENTINDDLVYRPEKEIVERKNPFCVISINTFGEYAVHDIQTNSSWGANPYGDTYAVVPDEMVEEIMETRGFCDIAVEDGVVTGFTAREIPEIPTPDPEPEQGNDDSSVWDELDAAYQEGVDSV